jgi:phosphoribosylformylglycinamidine synthase
VPKLRLLYAGMEPWDVTMSDLLSGTATLDEFQGIVFVGGFSYADTLDSAKGWASAIRFSEMLLPQFEAFYARKDTFSLGVCNGCQLMALLGWVPSGDAGHLPDLRQPRFVQNRSGVNRQRF